MIDSELTFKKLGLMGRFQKVSFLHVVHSRGFVSLSFVEISYIMNTHQELDEILEVSSPFYINKICIQLFFYHIPCCVFNLVSSLRWRTNVQVGGWPLVLDFTYNVGVISINERLKTNVGFFFKVCFQIIFVLMLVR